MNIRFIIACLLALAAAAQASAGDCIKDENGKVVCGAGQCATDQYGKVFCAKEGGGAMKDEVGNVKCGVGYCAANDRGLVRCSKRPGGGASIDSNGQVKCLGGCQPATKQLCEAPS
jgi:hypothetical protein